MSSRKIFSLSLIARKATQALWVLILSCFSSMPAVAMLEVAVQLESSWSTDSNPYRFSESSTVLVGNKKDDQILSVDLRTALVAPLISDRVRLEVVGSLGQREYATFNELNRLEKAIDTRLVWEAGDLFRGRLSYMQENKQLRVQDALSRGLDMTRIERLGNEIALRASEEIEFPVLFEKATRRQETAINRPLDRDEKSVQFSLRHRSPLGSLLNMGARKTEVDYPNRQGIPGRNLHGTDDTLFFDADWAYSALTRIGGYVGYLDRQYDSSAQQGYSRIIGKARLSYAYSSALNLSFDTWSQPGESSDPNVVYYTVNGLQGGLSWNYSAPTKLRMQFAREKQVEQLAAVNRSNGTNIIHRLGARLEHQLNPGWRIYVDALSDRISRSGGFSDINQKAFRAGVEYTYENIDGLAVKKQLGMRP